MKTTDATPKKTANTPAAHKRFFNDLHSSPHFTITFCGLTLEAGCGFEDFVGMIGLVGDFGWNVELDSEGEDGEAEPLVDVCVEELVGLWGEIELIEEAWVGKEWCVLEGDGEVKDGGIEENAELVEYCEL